jgi:hypothetical protein
MVAEHIDARSRQNGRPIREFERHPLVVIEDRHRDTAIFDR